MLSVCLYFHVHQPYRVKQYRVFDIGQDNQYFNDSSGSDLNNRKIIEKVAQKSYRPMIATLSQMLNEYPDFKFALSFSGTVLDQFASYAPDVLLGFQKLVASGRVEILADTYHHSLSFFYSVSEFEEQVSLHKEKIQTLFGYTPKVFRNTELSYRNDLAHWCEAHGYIGIMAEGWEPILGWRSPNFLYRPIGCTKIKVLLKNYKLSDDIAFRFGNRAWESYPISSETFAQWISAHHGNANTINLFMDFETFGEHQWEDTGIFNFMQALPGALKERDIQFKTPTQTIESYDAVGEIDVPSVLTWADTDRDLTAWTGNDIQKDAIKIIYDVEQQVKESGDVELIKTWRKLQTSDHFYYMCTKWSHDGDVHAYFSPYQSPYDAYVAFMNAVSDLQLRVHHAVAHKQREQERAEHTTPVVLPQAPLVQQRVFWERLVQWFNRIFKFFIRRKS